MRETKYWFQENKGIASIEEVMQKREMLGEEYNRHTESYRNMMSKVDRIIEKMKRDKINECIHDYIHISEKYSHHKFYCKKCGHIYM